MNPTVASQPAPRKGELSGDRLLEISATLFRQNGYSATTMRDIAQAAGMKSGSLYYHFQSKDQILDKVLERGISEAIRGFQAALANLPQNSCFDRKLRSAVTAHLRTVVDFGIYTVASRQLMNHVPEAVREKHIAMRSAYGDLWRRLLEEGVEQGAIRSAEEYAIVRLFLLGSLNWTSEWINPTRKSVEELGDIATDLFLNGLNPRPAGP